MSETNITAAERSKAKLFTSDLLHRLVASYAAAGGVLMFWALCLGLSGGFESHEHTPWKPGQIATAVTWCAAVVWTSLRTAWRPE